MALRILDQARQAYEAELASREVRAAAVRDVVANYRRHRSFFDVLRMGPARTIRKEVQRRGLFVEVWYRAEYPAERIGRDALGHFLHVGLERDLAPNPYFDPVWYRAQHGFALAEESPFLHYLRNGARQLLAPGPLFDPVAYLMSNPELSSKDDLLAHYLCYGLVGGKVATPVRRLER